MRKRHSVYGRLIGTLLVLLCTAGKSGAQLSPPLGEDAQAGSVSVFSALFESYDLEGFFSNAVYSNGQMQYWDAKRQHYCGRLLTQLYQPQILAAGYRQFECVKLEMKLEGHKSHTYWKGEDPTSFGNLREQTQATAASLKGGYNTTYHFDSRGWLRAIRKEHLSPQYEAYQETDDSLFYDFNPDGTAQIRWEQYGHQSGRNFASTVRCETLPDFFQIDKRKSAVLTLDSFGNVTSLKQHTEEIWDTCTAGGTLNFSLVLTYDAEGKMQKQTRFDSLYPSPIAEVRYTYEPLTLSQFYKRTDTSKAFAPLREPVLKDWLLAQPRLQVMEQQQLSTFYKYYNSKTGTETFRPDSPVVWATETTYFMLDAARQPVGYLPQSVGRDFVFSVFGKDSATGAPLHYLQKVPQPRPDATGGAVVCTPLTGLSATGYRNRKMLLGTDTVHIFSVGLPTQNARQSSINFTNELNTFIAMPLVFRSTVPGLTDFKTKSAAIHNVQGLLQYLWTPSNTYVLFYE